MLQIEDQKQTLRAIEPDLKDLASALGIDGMRKEIAELDQQAAQPDFWNDMENSQKVLKRAGSSKALVHSYEQLVTLFEDAQTMIEMAEEDDDPEMLEEIDKTLKELQAKIDEQRAYHPADRRVRRQERHPDLPRRRRRHRGPGLGRDALPDVHPLGASATASRYKVLDYLDGEEAGIKSASILIEGENAYGYLKSRDRRAPAGARLAL